MSNGRFSVVIPTLQRAPQLRPLVAMYAAHERVGEVIVVNNAEAPLSWESPKVRVLQQERNIYVNPAWNLGAHEAHEDLLLISNDDLDVDPVLITAAADRIDKRVGIIGPARSTLGRPRHERTRFTTTHRRYNGFGMWMAMHRASYAPIPDDLLIWCGDDWLFHRQLGRNLRIHGGGIVTPGSVTAGDASFNPVCDADLETYLRRYEPFQDSYWWRAGKRGMWADRAELYLSARKGDVRRVMRQVSP